MAYREQNQPNHPEIRLIRDAAHGPFRASDIYGLRLNAEGRKQAVAKGLELRDREIVSPDTRFEFSPTGWSIETMARIGAGIGKAANKNFDHVTEATGLQMPLTHETGAQITARAEKWLDHKADTMEGGDRVIAFTAEDMIAHIVARLEGLDALTRLHLQQTLLPVSETRLVFNHGNWRVEAFNQPIHFPQKVLASS